MVYFFSSNDKSRSIWRSFSARRVSRLSSVGDTSGFGCKSLSISPSPVINQPVFRSGKCLDIIDNFSGCIDLLIALTYPVETPINPENFRSDIFFDLRKHLSLCFTVLSIAILFRHILNFKFRLVFLCIIFGCKEILSIFAPRKRYAPQRYAVCLHYEIANIRHF